MFKGKVDYVLFSVAVSLCLVSSPIASMQAERRDSERSKMSKQTLTAKLEERHNVLTTQLSGETNKDRQEALSEELEQLEKQASEAGILLGKMREKDMQKREDASKVASAHEKWERMKVENKQRDQQAYHLLIQSFKVNVPNPGSLEQLLLLGEEDLYKEEFTNAVRNLQIKAQIEEEHNEHVLRAIRYLVNKFQESGKATNSKEVGELSTLKNAIDLRLDVLKK